jgi:hypothetical protein
VRASAKTDVTLSAGTIQAEQRDDHGQRGQFRNLARRPSRRNDTEQIVSWFGGSSVEMFDDAPGEFQRRNARSRELIVVDKPFDHSGALVNAFIPQSVRGFSDEAPVR